MIENVLHEKEIDIGDCRHQGCDNGANMSGRVKGVQAQILKRNHLATFSPLCLPRFKSCRCPCYTVKPRISNIFWLHQSPLLTFLVPAQKAGPSTQRKQVALCIAPQILAGEQGSNQQISSPLSLRPLTLYSQRAVSPTRPDQKLVVGQTVRLQRVLCILLADSEVVAKVTI